MRRVVLLMFAVGFVIGILGYLLFQGLEDEEVIDSVIKKFDEQLDKKQQVYYNIQNIRQQETITPKQRRRLVSLLTQNTGFFIIHLHSSESAQEIQQLQYKSCDTLSQQDTIQQLNVSISSLSKFESLEGFPGVCIHKGAHLPSVTELGRLYQVGFGVNFNLRLGLALFRYAASKGDPGAHGELGFLHQFGLHKLQEQKVGELAFSKPDFAGALVHLYFGALGGDSLSQLILAFRHQLGLGVPQSYSIASLYYQPLAEFVINRATKSQSLPQIEKSLLSKNHQWGLRRGQDPAIFQFYQNSADGGQHDAQAMVGRLLNIGVNGIPRNHKSALRYLKKAAKTGRASAQSSLGHMYAGGIEVPQDFNIARQYFKMAAEKRCPGAFFGLGYLYLNGLGVEKNHQLAIKNFQKTIDSFKFAVEFGIQDFLLDDQAEAGAQFYLGYMLQQGLGGQKQNNNKALELFGFSAQMGHLLGQYNAAMMLLQKSHGLQTSQKKAVNLLRDVVQKGAQFGIISHAYENYRENKNQQALIQYLKAGAMGSELAISNSAFIIEQDQKSLGRGAAFIELLCYQQAAEQGIEVALMSIGDLYWSGRGVQVNRQKAAMVYLEATNRVSRTNHDEPAAQAYFNLGIIHQFGQGLPKDLHLAKRCYDLAYETNKSAYLAVRIAIYILSIQKFLEDNKAQLPSFIQGLVSWLFSISNLQDEQQQSQFNNTTIQSSNLKYIQNTMQQNPTTMSGSDINLDTSWFVAAENFLIFALLMIIIYIVRQIQVLRSQQNNAINQITQQVQPPIQQVDTQQNQD